ncbi:MAG: hypothetical protein COC03_03195 [Robiginitomaculum sp.]|nr:MAG: hypothetical protein COC03_03195 [Robiginitomaculum sp.]
MHGRHQQGRSRFVQFHTKTTQGRLSPRRFYSGSITQNLPKNQCMVGIFSKKRILFLRGSFIVD